MAVRIPLAAEAHARGQDWPAALATPLAVFYVVLWAPRTCQARLARPRCRRCGSWWRASSRRRLMAAIAWCTPPTISARWSQWLVYAALGVLANAAYLG